MRPRHYVLIALIIGLGVFNFVRMHRRTVSQTDAPLTVASGPVPQSSAWSAFDKTVALRDAPESDFAPSLHVLQQAEDSASSTDKSVAEVKGCQTWLMFYRQGIIHPSKDPTWRVRSAKHLDNCVRTHHDAG